MKGHTSNWILRGELYCRDFPGVFRVTHTVVFFPGFLGFVARVRGFTAGPGFEGRGGEDELAAE